MFDTVVDPLAAAGICAPAEPADLDAAALVAAVESSHRLESILVARRLAAVAALLQHRLAAAAAANVERGFPVIDGFEQTTAEVAAVMNLSATGASHLVSHAQALDTCLPKVAALLAEGRTDWRTVRLIISRTDLVTDAELIAKLDESLATRIGKWHSWSRQRIVNAVDAAVRTVDPDAARERRRRPRMSATSRSVPATTGWSSSTAPSRPPTRWRLTGGSRSWPSRCAARIRARWISAAPMRWPR
jgi:hypothetical protein